MAMHKANDGMAYNINDASKALNEVLANNMYDEPSSDISVMPDYDDPEDDQVAMLHGKLKAE
jgi:hypothetical protein